MAELFHVQARSSSPMVKSMSELHIPPDGTWVTMCRGRIHTRPEGQAAIRCLVRDFALRREDLRLLPCWPRLRRGS